jgi:hypothetical protein
MEQTYTWACNVIRSCSKDAHFESADVLIYLFARKYGETSMVHELKELRQYKWVSVHGILS